MDRVAPTQRPNERNAGTQRWRDLLFVHWPIPVSALRPLIPSQLSIDTWEGVAYIGIVPFAMHDVLPTFLPKAMAFNFLETNLRTYVHLQGREPGVWFFSLEAESWLAVQTARLTFGLPYHHATMQMQKQASEVTYSTHRKASNEAHLRTRYTIDTKLGPSIPGSFEHFLLERYLLFSVKGGNLYRGQVHHTPYPAYRAVVHELEESLVKAAGMPQTVGLPPIAHYSPGVDVEVFALKSITKV